MAKESEESKTTVPIIDSHIHLYPASELSTLAWCGPNNPIGQQHSVSDYVAATSSHPQLQGFIFVETDRKNDLEAGVRDGSGWEYPLVEVDWLRRIALGQPRAGEGHDASHKALCLAIIPWAPLPSGAEAVERYVDLVRARAGEAWPRVRGFRYLVQYKPRGTCLTGEFVAGIRWLGRAGKVFEVGIDNHRDGTAALDECLEMMTRAHDGVVEEEKVTFILNHLCKPDMSLFASGHVQDNPLFLTWSESMDKLSRFSKTYMKLSGCFSEIPETYHDSSVEEIFLAIQPWLKVIVHAFGPSRIMFGSDWPVCTIGVAPNAWEKWRWIVQNMCEVEGFSVDDQKMIWSGTAVEAYGIKKSA